jgi:hypothetical protein
MNQIPIWGDAVPATRVSIPTLSKSRVTAGLQCLKRLYLECYARDTRDPIDASRQALFDAGRQVGEVARNRFPNGLLMLDDPQRHEEAAQMTREAMANPSIGALYEAAFTFDRIRVRIDVLARATNGDWDVIEVKSSTGYKEEYLADLAVQVHVAEGSGVPLRRASLLHVNNQYRWEGGPYDLEQLFAIQDLTESVRDQMPRLLNDVAAMRVPLWAAAPPDIAVGPHCRKPYVCPFYGTCHVGGTEHPIDTLPRMTPRLRRDLAALKVVDLRDIPDDFEGLSVLQRRVRDCARSGMPFVDPALKQSLEAIPYPIHFLDFETCNPALPIIPGTRPFQQTPFQWSDHILASDGTMSHREYLHLDRSDPCRPLAEALVDALRDSGAIVVYSGFEERMMRGLAAAIPGLSAVLLEMVENRIVDLYKLIHEHYYHPAFRGSFSIKDVLPVVAGGEGYDALFIKDGSQAALAFIEMTDPKKPAELRTALRDGLLAYCRLDTEAMTRLFRTLKEDP